MFNSGVQKDQSLEPGPKPRQCSNGHHATKAMCDNNRVGPETGSIGHRTDLRGIKVGRILIPVVTIAHSAEVWSNHMVVNGISRRDKVPPMRMSVMAMDHHQAGSALMAPPQIIQFDLIEHHR